MRDFILAKWKQKQVIRLPEKVPLLLAGRWLNVVSVSYGSKTNNLSNSSKSTSRNLQQFSFWLLSVNGRIGRARRSVARRLDCFRIVKEAAIGARRSDAPYQP